jgi:hypothetical protein
MATKYEHGLNEITLMRAAPARAFVFASVPCGRVSVSGYVAFQVRWVGRAKPEQAADMHPDG